MNTARMDHIVVGADSLEQGIDWADRRLGVTVPRGGVHAKMSTHNCVMDLGNDCYFEIVAIDPDAPAIDRGRWFGLDNPAIRRAVREEPRLLTWAANTRDIHAAFGRLAGTDFSVPFNVEAMSRDALSWEVGFAESGELIENGLFPLLLQWHVELHPSRGMQALGCELVKVEMISSRYNALRQYLSAIGALALVDENLFEGERDNLAVTLKTPLGGRRLSSSGYIEEVEL